MATSHVYGIPLLWEMSSIGAKRMVIWIPGFTSHKEAVHSHLRELAEDGYIGLSFDPVDHGERSRVDPDAVIDTAAGEFVAETDGHVYRHFWSVMAQSARELPTIIDWAINELGVEPVVGAGGISMGGDISVAAAALDSRIAVVAACISAPDWLKPGSLYELTAPNATVQADYAQHNPYTNLARYEHCPALLFECAKGDRIAPADGAQRFVAAVAPAYASCPERIQLHIENHQEHELTDNMWRRARSWFARWL